MALSCSLPHCPPRCTLYTKNFPSRTAWPRIPFQRSPFSEQVSCWLARRIPRPLCSRGNMVKRVQANIRQGRGEAPVEPSSSTGVENGVYVDSTGTSMKGHSRRKRSKKSKEASNSIFSHKEDLEVVPSGDAPRLGDSEARLESSKPLESSSLQTGNEGRITQSSSSYLRPIEMSVLQDADKGRSGEVVTNSMTVGIDQKAEVTRKRNKRRPKKGKNVLTSRSNGNTSSVGEVDPQPAVGLTADKRPLSLITVDTTGTSDITSYEGKSSVIDHISSRERTKKRKGTKKISVPSAVTERIKHQDLQSSSGRAECLTEIDLEDDDRMSSEVDVQSDLESNDRQASPQKGKRGSKKKTSRESERVGSARDTRVDAGEDPEGGTGVPRLELQSVQGDPTARDTSRDNGILKNMWGTSPRISHSMESVRDSGDVMSPQLHLENLQQVAKNELDAEGASRHANYTNGHSPNDHVILDSLRRQNEEHAADSEIGKHPAVSEIEEHRAVSKIAEIPRRVSSDAAKPAPARNRTRRRKKKPLVSPHSNTEMENSTSGSGDVFDTIMWCNVQLKAQGQLEHNESLYVVGANPELGGWDLSLAVPLVKTEEEGLWQTILKIPRGTMLEYKYFTEIPGSDPAVIDRCFGPELQYFLPWKEGEGAEVEIISDMWIPDVPTKLPLLSWGSRWWEEIDSAETDVEIDEEDGGDVGYIEEDLDHGSLEFDIGEVLNTDGESLEILESSVVPDNTSSVKTGRSKKKSRQKALPKEEEPGVVDSMTAEQRKASSGKKTEDAEVGSQETDIGLELPMVEKKEQSVQVEILINSPQCTMQRMAILEDGKLVELLLEPVTTKVQVGNIYLGVVKQLLPGMTGAFVDIGGFQLALMDITRNQYPHTFPSISSSAGGKGAASDDDEDSDWEGGETDDDGENDDENGNDHDIEIIEEEEDVDDVELDVEDCEVVKVGTRNRRSALSKAQIEDGKEADQEMQEIQTESGGKGVHPMATVESTLSGPITVNFGRKLKKWRKLQEGMQVIVQVKKEALGKKGPRLTAFPSLAGRFVVLIPGGSLVEVSRRITGPERKRLKQLGEELKPANFAITARTEALGCDREELEKDLARLMEAWNDVLERASVAAGAAEHGSESPLPVLLHRAMGQTLTIVRDFFTDRVHRMVIDSSQCYQEVRSYLQEVAPELSDRVELYTDKMPIFDAFGVEPEIEKFSSRRVGLPNGGYLVMEETEALVSIDVNGGTGVFSLNVPQEEAILGVNLEAARQIATEMRLRDMGGIIVVDFIDMHDSNSAKLVVEEMRKAISRDRSSLTISEISDLGLMEITRKRVRPSVTLTISDPCSCCGGVGRVEAHETTLSKIERAVRRSLAAKPGQKKLSDSSKWPQFVLRVDPAMGEYLKGRKRKRITQLSAALKVWLNLKVALELNIGQFQLLEQHRLRPNGTGSPVLKSNQPKIGPGVLRKSVWPGKRRRNFAQLSDKES